MDEDLWEIGENPIYYHQKRLYIISHIEELKEKYVVTLYNDLIEKILKKTDQHEYLFKSKKIYCLDLIKAYVHFEEDFFILYNPDTKEPSVITDVENYLPAHYRDNYAVNTLIQYMDDDASFSLPGKQMVKWGKTGVKKGAEYASKIYTKKGHELATQAERMATRPGRRDVTRHLRNKADKTKALARLAEKHTATVAKSQSLLKSGSLLGKMAKFLGRRSVGAAIDVVWPQDLGDATMETRNKTMVRLSIELELTEYCKKNYNFGIVYAQPKYFFNQG